MSFQNDKEFDASTYVKVNDRLKEFWSSNPNGRLETSCEVHEGLLIIKANLYKNKEDVKPAATGHSFLTDLDGDKVGEYTETVAVGRALALLGLQVEKSIASAEEMTRWSKNKQKKEVSDTPSVPKTLKPSRVFKPLNKQEKVSE